MVNPILTCSALVLLVGAGAGAVTSTAAATRSTLRGRALQEACTNPNYMSDASWTDGTRGLDMRTFAPGVWGMSLQDVKDTSDRLREEVYLLSSPLLSAPLLSAPL